MKKLSLLFLVTVIVVAFGSLNFGQTISYSTTAATITQDFNTLPASGTFTFTGNGPYQLSAAAPNGVGATGLAGWYGMNYVGTATTMVFKVDAGTNISGAVISYGTGTATDRALGTLASAGNIDEIGALITNNTGQTLNKVTITYTGEEWHENNTITNTMTFQYKVGATAINDAAGYVTNTNLNFVSPVYITTTSTALDGNAAANRVVGITYTIAGLTWANGTVLGIRWQDVNDAGSDQGLAIDDWSFSADVQSLTNYYYSGSGLLNVAANWNTNPSGTGGTAASNFTADGQIFNLRNTSSATTSGAWTVSGLGSKIVVGNGTNACALTIASGSPITSSVDISNNGTVVLQDATAPSFSSIDANSTIDYAQSATTAVAVGTYGNLKLTGSTKTMSAGTTVVQGNFTVDGVTNFDGPSSGFATVTVKGDITYKDGATCNSDPTNGITFSCNGTSLQTIYGNGIPISMFRLSVDNAAGVVLSTTGGATNLTLGNLSGGGPTTGIGPLTTGTNLVTLYNPGSSAGPLILSEAGTHYVIGNVTYTRTLGVVANAMGNVLWGAGIYGGENWGNVTVTRVTGAGGVVTVGSNSGIKATWTVSSTVAPSAGRNLILGFMADWLNGKDITTMQAYRSTDGGSSWATIGSQYNATTSVQDSLVSVSALGKFTFSDAAHPLVSVNKTLSLKAFFQGLSNVGGTAMENGTYPISVTVELHNSTSPYALVESKTAVLSNVGVGSFVFTTAANGTPYYLVVKSVNTVATWSGSAVSFTAGALSYDFTSAQAQAYGSNMVQIGSTWCIFTGDVNQDAAVDGLDLGAIDNDNNAFVSGVQATDLNGDGNTDGLDLGIVDNNNNAFVGSVVPSAAPAVKHVRLQVKAAATQK